MQDAYIGNWTQQSHVSTEHLTSMRGLNSRFLDLAGNGLLSPGLARQVAGLSRGAASLGGKLSLCFVRSALRG